jgi:hypothetical protein
VYSCIRVLMSVSNSKISGWRWGEKWHMIMHRVHLSLCTGSISTHKTKSAVIDPCSARTMPRCPSRRRTVLVMENGSKETGVWSESSRPPKSERGGGPRRFKLSHTCPRSRSTASVHGSRARASPVVVIVFRHAVVCAAQLQGCSYAGRTFAPTRLTTPILLQVPVIRSNP